MKRLPTALAWVSLFGLLAAGCLQNAPPPGGAASHKDDSHAGPAPAPAPAPAAGKGVLTDPGTLSQYRGERGKTLLFEVTGSDTGSVYGTDVYTDDSTLAAAAVHAGVLKAGQKGVVKVTMLPGQDDYPASTRHGITSTPWGKWDSSFRVEAAR